MLSSLLSETEIKMGMNNQKRVTVNPAITFYGGGGDSANYTGESLYSCVIDHFDQQKIWERYLGTKEGVSAGINVAEADYLHGNDIQILVIYNHVNDARGFDNGVDHAEQGIILAEALNIPDNVALFVDIESDYPVDSAFLEGWYEILSTSSYTPAFSIKKANSPKRTMRWEKIYKRI